MKMPEVKTKVLGLFKEIWAELTNARKEKVSKMKLHPSSMTFS